MSEGEYRNSLPVATVGIGVDYGYDVLSHIIEEFECSYDYEQTIEAALINTGQLRVVEDE